MTTFDDLPENDRVFATALRAQLHAGDEALDFVTASRLRAARARALGAARPASRGWLYASGGLTAAALIAAVLVLRLPHGAQQLAGEGSASAQAEAIEVLTDEVDADFYEDLDLYSWLDRNHDDAA